MLTNQNIAEHYDQIKDLSLPSINTIICDAVRDTIYSYNGNEWMLDPSITGIAHGYLPRLHNNVYFICKKAIGNNKKRILNIVRNNSNKSDIILKIVEAVAPSIALEYGDLSTMAIVATLTVLCNHYIKLFIIEIENEKKNENNQNNIKDDQ